MANVIRGLAPLIEERIARDLARAMEDVVQARMREPGHIYQSPGPLVSFPIQRPKTRGTPKNFKALEQSGILGPLLEELGGVMDEGYKIRGAGNFYDYSPALEGARHAERAKSAAASSDAVEGRARQRIVQDASAIAAMSPQKAFTPNVRDASYVTHRYLSGLPIQREEGGLPYPYGSLGNSILAAERALKAGIGAGSDGPKTNNFFANLIGDWTKGTMDAGMQRSLVFRIAREDPELAIQFGVPEEFIRAAQGTDGGVFSALVRSPSQITSSLKGPQYYAFEDLFNDLARSRGAPEAGGQATTWAADGDVTGIGRNGGTWGSQLLAHDFNTRSRLGLGEGVPLLRHFLGTGAFV